MCTRYIISTTQAAIESIFSLPPQSLVIENNYNISPGQLAPVITNEKPYEIQLFKFGLTPFWAKAEMNLINARTEGEYNQDDNPRFSGAKGILLTKAFRKPIRSQRCLVIASAFIEGLAGQSVTTLCGLPAQTAEPICHGWHMGYLAQSCDRISRKLIQHHNHNR
jgi:putative SOS response-associated peptidase YedK